MADLFDTDPELRVLDNNVAGLSNNINNGCSSPGDEEVETLPGSSAGAMQQDEPQEEAGTNEVMMTVCDPDHTEERFRVDRKKLEQMLQAQGGSETGEEFFQRIMEETETHISWPSKLKIGAKSKKDPHIKVTGKPGNVASAKDKIMSVLDTKSNRVTLKMDVSYTEHSHVIGKGGNIIKKVMEDTGCHINFPDSNRGKKKKKSNQVSIAGQVCGVEKARFKIRELLPLVLFFELPITCTPMPDMNSPTIQQIVQSYNVSVNMKQRSRGYSTTVTVRGASNNAAGLKEGTLRLMEHLTGSLGVTLPVSTQIEIAPQHHQFMIGRGGLNIKQIMQGTGATIHFPDPNNAQRKSSVFVSGSIDSVIIARHLLMGCLPLVLMFDIKEDVEVESSKLAQMMEQLDVFISVKPKPKQPSKSVIVKSIERNAPNMYLARQKLLGQECESCAAHHAGNHGRGLNGTTLPLTGLNVGSIGMLGQGGLNINTANILRINGHNGLSAVPNASHSPAATSATAQWMGTSSTAAIQQGLQSTVPPVLMQQAAINSLLRPPTNPLQVNQTTAGLIPSIPTTLTPTISTSLTPGLTTTSVTPGLPPCTTPSIVPTPTLATSLSTPLHSTALSPSPAPAQASFASALASTVSRHTATSQIPSVVHVTSALQNLTPLASLTSGVAPHLTMMSQQTSPSTQSIRQAPTPVSCISATMPEGVMPPTSKLATRVTPAALPTTSPPSMPTGFIPTSIPPPLLPPPKSTSVTQLQHMQAAAMSLAQQNTVHKPSPPPGFFPRPDPAAVSAQLAQLDMGRVNTAALLHNNSNVDSSMRHSAFVRVSRQLKDSGGSHSNTSSSCSPTSSPSNSPIDLIATSTTSPLNHLCNNNNKMDMMTKTISATTLIELLSRNNSISPNNSGNFASVFGGNGLIEQISPSNSGNFASRLGQHISPSNSGNFSSLFGSGGGVQQDQNGLNRSGSRPSSESGGESDSSDKRAPGCERRTREKERERQWEREREIEQHRQQELDGLMQDDAAVTYEQKKLMANKAMKQKPVVSQPRTPTDTWSGLGFSKSMPESAIREARQKNGFSLFQRSALPTMHESSITEEEGLVENESSWPPDRTSSDAQPASPTSGEFNPTHRKKKYNPYDPLSRSNYIDSTSLPRYTKGLWSNGDMDINNSSKKDDKQDLSELFIKLGLSKYTNVFQQQEIDLATFSTLTDSDLKELGISTFGARRKMLLAISDLNKNQANSFQLNGTNGSAFGDQTSNNHYNSNQRGRFMNPARVNETAASCW
ncbi:LOW QUALITY PROTEIN: protein bicaudal C homolog 1-like [Amphiura filiformis]|uniref:LOW QUALITY PROTEIN: protein bicaudal C homolog 1-like n=1 Tax=Amphiura filiformis TaxID=82378 RepID=UPI003B20E92C